MTANHKYHKKPCSFRALMQERYAPKVYRKVIKVVNDPVVASQLVGEIIEEACDCFSTIPPSKEIRVFLYSLAYNKSLEYSRSKLKQSL